MGITMSRPRSKPPDEIGPNNSDIEDRDSVAADDMVSEGGYVPPVVGTNTGGIFEGLTIHHHPSAVATETLETEEKSKATDRFKGLTIKEHDKEAPEPESKQHNVEQKSPRKG